MQLGHTHGIPQNNDGKPTTHAHFGIVLTSNDIVYIMGYTGYSTPFIFFGFEACELPKVGVLPHICSLRPRGIHCRNAPGSSAAASGVWASSTNTSARRLKWRSSTTCATIGLEPSGTEFLLLGLTSQYHTIPMISNDFVGLMIKQQRSNDFLPAIASPSGCWRWTAATTPSWAVSISSSPREVRWPCFLVDGRWALRFDVRSLGSIEIHLFQSWWCSCGHGTLHHHWEQAKWPGWALQKHRKTDIFLAILK